MNVPERIPITFTGANGDDVHCPLVVGVLGGRELRFVLDTGSDVHLLAESLADELGLTKEPGGEGTDHSGASISSWSVGDVVLALGDRKLDLRGVVAIPAPGSFGDLGIGGILSPHRLDPAAWAVIDMDGDELVFASGEAHDLAALVRSLAPQHEPVALTREPGYATVVVRAAIEPFAPLPTLLNTGGTHTEFAADAVPELATGDGGRLGRGVGGADIRGTLVGSQVLLVEGRRVRLQSLAVRESMPELQAMIGMDVLRGTVLACCADRTQPVVWSVRAPSGDQLTRRRPQPPES